MKYLATLLAITFGALLGYGLGSMASPPVKGFQTYTSEVSYLVGRMDQAEYTEAHGLPDPAVTKQVLCQMYTEDHLATYPRGYVPARNYKALTSICQTSQEQ